MISLIVPPKDQIARVARMLSDEYGTASNIKSRVNRLSVLSAIVSVQGRLKLYPRGTLCVSLCVSLSVLLLAHQSILLVPCLFLSDPLLPLLFIIIVLCLMR